MFVKQPNEQDCGVACISMILKHHNSNVQLRDIRTGTKTDRNGTTAFGIKKYLENKGFDCSVAECNDNIWYEEELTYPLIAHVVTEEKGFHFVVVKERKNDELLILDPAKGIKYKKITDFNKIWTNINILSTPNSTYTPIKEKNRNFSHFISLLLNGKKNNLVIFLFSIITIVVGISFSYIYRIIVDSLIPSANITYLNATAILLIFIVIIKSISSITKSLLLTNKGYQMSLVLFNKYLKHVFYLPLEFFYTRKNGDILSRLLDINKIINALLSLFLTFSLDLGMIVGLSLIILNQNKSLFFIVILTIPIYSIIIRHFYNKINKAQEEEMQAYSIVNANLLESLSGIESIKATNEQNNVLNKLDKNIKNYFEKSFSSQKLNYFQAESKEIVTLLLVVSMIWVGSILVIKDKLSIGELLSLQTLLVLLTSSIKNIINLQNILQTGFVASDRLTDVLEEKTEEKITQDVVVPIGRNIQLKNVDVSYGFGETILENMSFNINHGDKIAIFGKSGSGKSTIAKMLVKFIEPSHGEISIGGVNIEKIPHKEIRKIIHYVPQQSFIINGTILDNLLFGSDPNQVTEKEIIEACKVTELYTLIAENPMKFDMAVQENGNNLSGGQKQKIALTRAILHKSDICIFDEATSALDIQTEDNILKRINSIPDLTVIFISHRPSISNICDYVLDIKNKYVVKRS